MSDLSRLLDDVYGSGTPASEPAWSSDRALDDAFEHWVPGPPAEASEEERSYAQDWAEAAGNTPDAAVAFSEALSEQQAAPPADPFGSLHALLEEAIRLAPAADAETAQPTEAIEAIEDAEPEPAPRPAALFLAYADPEPEPEAGFLAYAAAEPEPDPEAGLLAYAEAEPEPAPDPEAGFLAYAVAAPAPEPAPEAEPEALFLAFAAAAEREVEPEVAPTTYVAAVPVAGWSRSDDDILPVGRSGRGIKLLRRRR